VIEKIRHIGIVVKNLEESLQFYKLLGFKIDGQKRVREPSNYVDTLLAGKDIKLETLNLIAPDGSIIELLEYEMNKTDVVELLEYGKNRTEEKQTLFGIGISHIAFTVRNIEEIYNKLTARGIKFNSPPQVSPNGYVKIAFCQAPEGSYLELVEVL